MKKRRPVIRVVTDIKVRREIGMFLEQLRYMGLITMHREDETGLCFDIQPPGDLRALEQQEQWCKMNAERMRSFGYNAVVAPWAPARSADSFLSKEQ